MTDGEIYSLCFSFLSFVSLSLYILVEELTTIGRGHLLSLSSLTLLYMWGGAFPASVLLTRHVNLMPLTLHFQLPGLDPGMTWYDSTVVLQLVESPEAIVWHRSQVCSGKGTHVLSEGY